MRVVFGLSLLAFTACGARDGASPGEPPSAAVTLASVERGAIREEVEAFGVVELDPDRTRIVTVPHAGRVGRVLVVPGQLVEANEVLFELDPVPADRLEVRRARLDGEFAERELERIRHLRAEHLATNAQLEAAERSAAEARATLDAFGYGNAGAALRATEPSVVARVDVSHGAMVQPGESALALAQRGAVTVRAGFLPEQRERIGSSNEVLVSPVFGAADTEPVACHLGAFQGMIDPVTQLAEALVRVDDAPAWMLAGTRVRLRATVGAAEAVLLVPRDALLTRAGAVGVFVLDGEVARWRPIETGLESPGSLEVRSGLRAGDRVITQGRTLLEDGAAVRATEPSA